MEIKKQLSRKLLANLSFHKKQIIAAEQEIKNGTEALERHRRVLLQVIAELEKADD